MLAAGRGDPHTSKSMRGVPVDEGYSHPHPKARDFIGPQLRGEQLVDWGTEVEKVMPIASKDELWDVVLAAWDTVPQQQMCKLVNSFLNRGNTLLARNGMKIQKSAKIGFRVEIPPPHGLKVAHFERSRNFALKSPPFLMLGEGLKFSLLGEYHGSDFIYKKRESNVTLSFNKVICLSCTHKVHFSFCCSNFTRNFLIRPKKN